MFLVFTIIVFSHIYEFIYQYLLLFKNTDKYFQILKNARRNLKMLAIEIHR